MGKDIKITFDTIFELLRNEKNKSELQKLDETFFKDVVDYLTEKNQMVISADSNAMFAQNDLMNTQTQILNIKKMLKDLYDKRESKIINMALNKARTGSNIIDTSALLSEEMELYISVSEIFSKFRNDVLMNVLNSKIPAVNKIKLTIDDCSSSSDGLSSDSSNNSTQSGNKMIRFISAVPKFVGKDLEVYGPFEEEDIANLPSEIADVLVLKERAEEINQS